MALDDVDAVEVGSVDPEAVGGCVVEGDVLDPADPELFPELRDQLLFLRSS